jgi:hypothetical protein
LEKPQKIAAGRLNIVRTTTDDGKRLVGVNIPGETIGEIRRAFGLWRNTAANAAEILRSAREENETIELLGEMKIRPARFQGQRLIEITPSSYDQIRELRETALVNIIQNSRSRFFLPENDDSARETLEKVLKAYPPVYLLKDEGSPVCEQNTTVLTEDYQAVRLPDWLIEPPTGEIERIKVREFLSKIKTSEIKLC